MSLRSQLVEPLTIIHPAMTAGFDYGVGATRTDVLGKIDHVLSRVLPQSGFGLEDEEELSKWTVFLMPDAVIHTSDRVQRGVVIFEVIGNPEPLYVRGRLHHWEATVKAVTGDN